MSTIYLKDIPLPDALACFQEALKTAGLWQVLGQEELPLDEALLNRVLAEPVWAKISSPHYHAVAMDGYAVRAEDTIGALSNKPLDLKIGNQAEFVDTGDVLPQAFNAVVPIEYVELLDATGELSELRTHPDGIRLRAAVTPWSYVRPMGEDIVVSELVFPAGHILRPADLGALAASGQEKVIVARQPRVAILPSGSELVPVGSPLKPGNIIEFNSIVLAAQIKAWGGNPIRFPIVPDDLEQICHAIEEAAKVSDLVLLNAGSSAGSEDFSAQAIEKLGYLLVHGVAVRPGHPVILGMLCFARGDENDKRPVAIIGVPGYPVSAALTGEIFIEPLLARWLGRNLYEPITIDAKITHKVTSPAGDDEYLRVILGKVADQYLAAPLGRGAGLISSLVKADGITIIPRGTQGVEAGAKVKVRLYCSPAEIDRTILAIGSHDLTLDLLAQYLTGKQRRLASANVGSLGGLLALKRGEAHLAGSHLLDPETGEYNISYIRQYLTGIPVVVMGWVNRQQGLLVMPGNPKGIHSLLDLTRTGVTFINRQRGAGTRVLLDYHLRKLGVAPSSISGYNQEEYTHLCVAAAISSGRSDCGLGISAAAQALGLDFIPLYWERYDLVIPKQHFKSSLVMPLRDLAMDEQFRQKVISLPGYQIDLMGIILAEME